MTDRGSPERDGVYKKDPEWAERIIAPIVTGDMVMQSIERRFREHVKPTWDEWDRPVNKQETPQ